MRIVHRRIQGSRNPALQLPNRRNLEAETHSQINLASCSLNHQIKRNQNPRRKLKFRIPRAAERSRKRKPSWRNKSILKLKRRHHTHPRRGNLNLPRKPLSLAKHQKHLLILRVQFSERDSLRQKHQLVRSLQPPPNSPPEPSPTPPMTRLRKGSPRRLGN